MHVLQFTSFGEVLSRGELFLSNPRATSPGRRTNTLWMKPDAGQRTRTIYVRHLFNQWKQHVIQDRSIVWFVFQGYGNLRLQTNGSRMLVPEVAWWWTDCPANVFSWRWCWTDFTGTPPKEQTFTSHRTVYLDIHLGYLIYHMRLDYLLLLYPRLIDSFPRFYISFLWFIRC